MEKLQSEEQSSICHKQDQFSLGKNTNQLELSKALSDVFEESTESIKCYHSQWRRTWNEHLL